MVLRHLVHTVCSRQNASVFSLGWLISRVYRVDTDVLYRSNSRLENVFITVSLN